MKRMFRIMLCLPCIILISCDLGIGGLGGYTPPLINCAWTGLNKALFLNVYLLPPCSDGQCDYTFNNNTLNLAMDCGSMIPLFEQCRCGLIGNSTCNLKWVVSVIPDQVCTSSTSQAQHISLTESNYMPKLVMYGGGCDAILESPHETNVSLYDHKHEITIQLYNVTNWDDSSEGTITWHYKWASPIVLSDTELEFVLPNNGWMGTYTPIYHISSHRHIYINGYYDDI